MLGSRIAALRRRSNMSQAELARQLKISPSAVGMYEQGRREPSVELVVEMAGLFSVTTDYLLMGTEPGPEEEEAFSEIMNRIALTEQHMKKRKDRAFSRQELAVLFAAMLMEP